MNVHVLVSQMEPPSGLREWVGRRLHEVLGDSAARLLSVAVVLNPVVNRRSSKERLVRCSVVVTTTSGRRVVETRDVELEAALERALRLVSLSLFSDPATPDAELPERYSPMH